MVCETKLRDPFMTSTRFDKGARTALGSIAGGFLPGGGDLQ